LAQDKRRLVGFRPVDKSEAIVAGSHLFTQGETRNTTTDQGWITSAAYSPHVGSSIAIGFLEEGDARMGEVVIAANPLEGREVRVEVVSPHFVDPEGGRLRD
jgi:glycine cleavage system aminomethyltransferase T